MTREVAEAIGNLDRRNPVVNLEDGRVWVSGMNARPWVLARQIEEALDSAGNDHGEVTDDGAALHGGLVIPVPGCEEISDEVHQTVIGNA